ADHCARPAHDGLGQSARHVARGSFPRTHERRRLAALLRDRFRIRIRMDAVRRSGARHRPRACGNTVGNPHRAALLALYSAGLAIPFLLTALSVGKFLAAYKRMKAPLAYL